MACILSTLRRLVVVMSHGPLYLSTGATGKITYWGFRVICHITVGGITYDEDLQSAYYPPDTFHREPFVGDGSSESYVLSGNRILTAVGQNNTSMLPSITVLEKNNLM